MHRSNYLMFSATKDDRKSRIQMSGGDGLRPRVLIIESSRKVGNFIASMLSKFGYSTYQSREALESNAKVIEWRPDVVILDCDDAAGLGLDFASEMLSATPILKMIVLLERSIDTDLAEEIGAEVYLEKPAYDNNLCRCVQVVSRLKSPIPIVSR